MADVIVEIRGGTLVGIYSDEPSLRAVVVDWDEISSGGKPMYYRADDVAALPQDTQSQYQQAARCPPQR